VEIMDRLVEQDMVLVILGNGEDYYERLLHRDGARYPGKVRVQVSTTTSWRTRSTRRGHLP